MVLLCENGQKGIYSLAVIIVYTSILCSLVRSITTVLTITLEKKTQISRFQLKKLSFCSSDVLEAFLCKKSLTQPRFCNNKICNARNLINCTSVNELSSRIANDFVNKTTSNCQWKVNFHYFF